MTDYKIRHQQAIEHLLYDRYTSEFEVIDGLRQHPDGLTYEDWLEYHHLLEGEL